VTLLPVTCKSRIACSKRSCLSLAVSSANLVTVPLATLLPLPLLLQNHHANARTLLLAPIQLKITNNPPRSVVAQKKVDAMKAIKHEGIEGAENDGGAEDILEGAEQYLKANQEDS
jgi:hypothetical protein